MKEVGSVRCQFLALLKLAAINNDRRVDLLVHRLSVLAVVEAVDDTTEDVMLPVQVGRRPIADEE